MAFDPKQFGAIPASTFNASQFGATPVNHLNGFDVINQKKKQSIADLPSQLSDAVTTIFPGKEIGKGVGSAIAGVGEAIKEKSFAPIHEAAQEINANMGKTIGDIGSAIALPLSFALGGGTGSTILGRVANAALKYGGLGALSGGSESLKKGENVGTAVGKATLGGTLGAIGGGIVQGAGELLGNATKVLSKTSGVPEKQLQVLNQRADAFGKIGEATPQTALENTQGAVRNLRTTLTQSWKDGVSSIADEFSGQRVGLPDKTASLLQKVDSAYSLDSIPQNTSNISAKELINLQTEVNNLASKPALKISPEGVPVRKLADELKQLGVDTFGGREGSYAKLYDNYSAQKSVFDAANDIVKAFQTKKPISQTTALSRLQKVFNDNAPAYLEAMSNLEQATGKDVLGEIAASGVQNVLPKLSGIGNDAIKDVFKILALPLTSPRGAAYLSKLSTMANNPEIGKLIQAITALTSHSLAGTQ